MNRCLRCGLEIIQHGTDQTQWVANKDDYEAWEDEGRNPDFSVEPWQTACPGDMALLSEYPTFGSWTKAYPHLDRGLDRHEPMDALSLLAWEVTHDL